MWLKLVQLESSEIYRSDDVVNHVDEAERCNAGSFAGNHKVIG